MNKDDFTDKIYDELFLRDKTENTYERYWLSSRAIDSTAYNAGFNVGIVYSGKVGYNGLYMSGEQNSTLDYIFRPIVSLKSDIKLDITDTTKDGSTAANAWIIK